MRKNKSNVNVTRLSFLVLLTAFVCAVGCATRTPDPLAGWKVLMSRDSEKVNQAIKDDCRNYIQKLPPEENKYVRDSNIWFLEDGIGQHAVRITIFLNGTNWEHVLIYNRDNKRVKVIKYISGYYRS